MQARFLTGVIEGFYGRQWSMEMRHNYADYLGSLGLNSYIYAPKADPYLRRRWQEHWPADEARALHTLASHYSSHGLHFGVGLSPFELYKAYGPEQRRQLQSKVGEITGLGVSLLSILFDDMPGDLPNLAERQTEIIADVLAWAPGLRLQFCPTYYSFDPVLEKVFGERPARYWETLGGLLPAEVDIYWTGNQVCATAIKTADVARINALLGRKVMLWDNYPVNDGAVRSKRLYCEPLSSRDEGLSRLLTGHLCNPMNQALLSLPALEGLSALYGSDADEQLVERTLGRDTWTLLQQHRQAFAGPGLDGLDETAAMALAEQFDALKGPAAAEVAGWLRGEYTFDPACLTD